MGAKKSKQAQNLEVKCPDVGNVFIACNDGSVVEFSMIEKKVVQKQKISDTIFYSMAKTSDNKTQFLCDGNFKLKVAELSTLKPVKGFREKDAFYCVVTHDNQFLITADHSFNGHNGTLIKWSMQTKKQLHKWQSGVDTETFSLSVSQDSKYQLIGYYSKVSIFDLQKDKTLKNIEIQCSDIHSVAFTHDNQSAFISCIKGSINVIKWQADAKSGDVNFDDPVKFYLHNQRRETTSICLTNDDKYLLIGCERRVRIFDTTTKEKIKRFEIPFGVQDISLSEEGKKAIIAEFDGNIHVIDLETLEIEKIADTFGHGQLNKILVI